MQTNQKLAVWKKTMGRCWYCCAPLPLDLVFHCDHMVPASQGGSDEIENLVPACTFCNLQKGTMTAEEYFESPALSLRADQVVLSPDDDVSTVGITRDKFIKVYNIALAWVRHIGANAFAVYSTLLIFKRNDKDEVYPSILNLCYRTGLSKPTVIKSLKALEQVGLISKVKGKSSYGTKQYRIVPPLEVPLPPAEVKNAQGKKSLPKLDVVNTASGQKSLPDPRIREFFIKWASTGIIDPTPKGMIAGRIKALPPEITVAALCGAVDAFIAKPDPWVKQHLGITFRGFMQQLPKLVAAHNTKLKAHVQPQTRVILTDDGPKRVPV